MKKNNLKRIGVAIVLFIALFMYVDISLGAPHALGALSDNTPPSRTPSR